MQNRRGRYNTRKVMKASRYGMNYGMNNMYGVP